MTRPLPVIAIVTPYLAEANNGNWRTAHRWRLLLTKRYEIIVQNVWPLRPARDVDALIVLHALRSAKSAQDFRAEFPGRPLIVTLTGTDLYRDLKDSAKAIDTLAAADALIVLQDDAITHVPTEFRRKTHVIYQSATPLTPAKKSRIPLNCVVVGHLRSEKDPETIFRWIESLPASLPLRILHIGAPLDEKLAAKARCLCTHDARYRWAGALPHGLTRAAIKRADVLIHPSIMEGGANVIVEAISSGTPVIASHMSGNIGMLGPDYPGYFPVGDAEALRSIVERCIDDANFVSRLNTACAARAKLFLPEIERAGLCRMIDELLARKQ
jgi:putative glycosyltransferase (TIGR04348 family)